MYVRYYESVVSFNVSKMKATTQFQILTVQIFYTLLAECYLLLGYKVTSDTVFFKSYKIKLIKNKMNKW